MIDKTILIKCNCGTEGIQLNKFDDEVYLSFWIMTWYTGSIIQEIKERFKVAFNILFKGKYQYQEIILNKNSVQQLRDGLYEVVND